VGEVREVRDARAVLLDLEQLVGNADLKVAPDFDLAGEPDVGLLFLRREPGRFGRQQRPGALQHRDLAQAAGAASAAGRGNEEALVLERREQRAAAGDGQRLLAVDRDTAGADTSEGRCGDHQQQREPGVDGTQNADRYEECCHIS